jgi:hypothetical protein
MSTRDGSRRPIGLADPRQRSYKRDLNENFPDQGIYAVGDGVTTIQGQHCLLRLPHDATAGMLNPNGGQNYGERGLGHAVPKADKKYACRGNW